MTDLISPPQVPKQLDEKIYLDPQRIVRSSSSTPSPRAPKRGQHPTTHGAPAEGPSLVAGNDKDTLVASVSASRAQSRTRPPVRRPSLRRTKRISARTFTAPVRPRSSKITLSVKERTHTERSDTSSQFPVYALSEPRTTSRYVASAPAKTMNTGLPKAYTSHPGTTYPYPSKEKPPIDKQERDDESESEEDEGEDEGSDDDDGENDEDEYEDDTEAGEGTNDNPQDIKIRPGPIIPQRTAPAPPARVVEYTRSKGNHVHGDPRGATAGAPQSYTTPPEPISLASNAMYHRVPQEHQNGHPHVASSLEDRSNTNLPHYSHPHGTFMPRPASFGTSRSRPPLVLEGPHRTTWPSAVAHPTPFGPPNRSGPYRTSGFSFCGDVAGPSSELGEVSEACGSEQRSIYSLQSNMSVARSTYMEQQVARREEEAARREEEALRKEEDARGLEMAARRAFAWVQGLEARAGRIHDAAMEAEARAKRRDAEILEKEAEVLRQQAETAKREVQVAKREIAAERAEHEARRKAREARRKEVELLLKEEDVRRKEQETIQMEEEVRRERMEVRRREEKVLKQEKGRRRTTEDWAGTRDAVVAAWQKLKGRISREPQVDKKQKSPPRVHPYGDPDTTNDFFDDMDRGSDSTSRAQIQNDSQDGSTREDAPHPRDVERWRSMVDANGIRGPVDEDVRSVPDTIPSDYDCGTSAEASAEYTVKTVHSYKERLHRSPAGYFRHVG